MFAWLSSKQRKKFRALEKIIEALPGHVFWKDEQGVYLGCNESHAKNAGLACAKEIIGKTDYDLAWKDHAEQLRKVDAQVMAEDRVYTIEEPAALSDGSSVVYLSQKMPLKNEQGKIEGIIGIAFDITAQKALEKKAYQVLIENAEVKAELKAKEHREYLESILAVMPGHLYWKNKEGVFLGCNNLQAIDAGFSSPVDMIGKTDYELPWKDQAELLRRIDLEVMETQVTHVVEEPSTLADGRQAIFLSQKMPMRNKQGEVTGILGISLDVTAQKQAEAREKAALIEAFEAQAKAEEDVKFSLLAAQVAHDIRSPLAALEIVTKQITTVTEKQRVVMRSSLNSIRDIANNLLSEYQLRTRGTTDILKNSPSAVLLLPFIDSVLSEKRVQFEKKKIVLKLEVDSKAVFSFVNLNTLDFKRLLSNLINNSAEAMPQGGVITLRVQLENQQILLEVIDTGIGILPEVMQRLFQVGASFGKENGSGLGLIHARQSVETWGGKLALTSEVGVGTKIHIRLPLINSPEWAVDQLTFAPNSLILILDDDQSMHDAWEIKFSEMALTLLHFKNSQELLAWAASASRVDLMRSVLLSDYELIGSRETGLDVIEKSAIRPAILVTSYFEDATVLNRCLQLGVKLIPKTLIAYLAIVFQ